MIAAIQKSKKYGIALVCLLCIYILTRLIHLSAIPIFTDEAIYIRWSQIGSRDASWRFISLVDGKQPMFTWIMMVYLKIIKLDPLVVGRLVSVTSGIFTSIGVWFVSRKLFHNNRAAFIASFLYIISPFALMYDKLALYDSLVAAFYIWSLYFSIRLIQELRLDIAFILAMVFGGGMLNKSSGFISLYLLPSTLVIFDKKKPVLLRIKQWLFLAFIAGVLSQVYYSVLRLSPLFHMIALKNTVFIYPLNEWIRHPFTFLRGNLNGLFDWLTHYMTLPVFIASLLPLLAFWSKFKEKILLIIYWLLPFIGLAMFGKVLYPRFIFFMTIPLFILAALTVDWIWRSWKRFVGCWIALAVIIFPSVYISYMVIVSPIYAPIPLADRGQILDDWPSGGGVREVNDFLKKASVGQKIVVYTEGTFGLMPYALEIYAIDNPLIEIHGIWPLPDIMPTDIIQSAKFNPTYFILNETQVIPPSWNVRLIATYQKGNRPDRALRLYQVIVPVAESSIVSLKKL